MPEFVYIGDGRDSPAYTTFKGVPFRLHGDPVNVEDPHIVEKLRGNPTFQEFTDGELKAKKKAPDFTKDWEKPAAKADTKTDTSKTDEKEVEGKKKA